MIGSVAVVTNERSNVGGDCVVAASAADSVGVTWVVTRGEERCWHPCHRFGDVVSVKAKLQFRGSCGSTMSLELGSCGYGLGRRKTL